MLLPTAISLSRADNCHRREGGLCGVKKVGLPGLRRVVEEGVDQTYKYENMQSVRIERRM